MEICDYEPLDFSKVLETRNVAVNCASKDEALHLLAAMKTQHPEKCSFWEWPDVNWCDENETYCLGLYAGDRYDIMLHASISSFHEDGYTVIPFSDLLFLGQCEESDKPFSFLFDTEV